MTMEKKIKIGLICLLVIGIGLSIYIYQTQTQKPQIMPKTSPGVIKYCETDENCPEGDRCIKGGIVIKNGCIPIRLKIESKEECEVKGGWWHIVGEANQICDFPDPNVGKPMY